MNLVACEQKREAVLLAVVEGAAVGIKTVCLATKNKAVYLTAEALVTVVTETFIDFAVCWSYVGWFLLARGVGTYIVSSSSCVGFSVWNLLNFCCFAFLSFFLWFLYLPLFCTKSVRCSI